VKRLGQEIRRAAWRAGFSPASALVEVWSRVVGDTIAANAWPARLNRAGVLQVNTTSATWAFELKHLAPRILEKLGAELPEGCPTDIRFAPGPVPEKGHEASSSVASPTHPAGERERSLAEEMTASITGEELRALVARAAAASLAQSDKKTPFGHTSGRRF
jgi:hypothetical protein